MENCKIITVANQKGGTSKTTTVRNLGNSLMREGKRVLLIDFDPQTNLSLSFGIENPDELALSAHEILTMLMEDKSLPDRSEYIIRGNGMDIIPCNSNLSVTEINMRHEYGAERTLLDLLEPLRPEYEYIIIDTNPSLGMLTINALAACDSVIIPVSPEYWSATGLTSLLQTIFKIKRKINPRISIEGILMTMCEMQTILYRDVKTLLHENFADKIRIYDTHIPRTTKVGYANLSSVSVMEYASRSKAAIAYENFSQEQNPASIQQKKSVMLKTHQKCQTKAKKTNRKQLRGGLFNWHTHAMRLTDLIAL